MHCISRGGSYLVNSFCDVQEENKWKKESYRACWISLVLETRLQYRQTLSEKDSSCKEGYKQQQVVHFIVERNLSQTLKLSSSNGDTTEHQLLLFKTNRRPFEEKTSSESSKHQLKKGLQIQDTAITATSDIVKPIQTNFRAVSLMSSPRQINHMGQDRE